MMWPCQSSVVSRQSSVASRQSSGARRLPAQPEAGDPDSEQRQRRRFRNADRVRDLEDLSADLAAAKLRRVEIDVGAAVEKKRQLVGQCDRLPLEIPFPSGRSHFLLTIPPTPFVNGVTIVVRCRGLDVVEGRSNEAPDHAGPLVPAGARWMWATVRSSSGRAGRLRPAEIEAEHCCRPRQCRLRIVQLEGGRPGCCST